MTDTLIGDGTGICHTAFLKDRPILGLKGTMLEAELHVLRARLDGGIRNKATRVERRWGLPVGFVGAKRKAKPAFNPTKPQSARFSRCPQSLLNWVGPQGLALVPFRRTLLSLAPQHLQPGTLGWSNVYRRPSKAH
jgi:hypothetical protein